MERILYYLIPITFGLWIGWLLSGRGKGPRKLDKTRVQTLELDSFKQNMRKGQLVDIRKPNQFNEGHIKGARNFRLSYLKLKNQKQVRKDQPLYIYCNTGRKAQAHSVRLLKKGFIAVYTLKGGYTAYKQNQ